MIVVSVGQPISDMNEKYFIIAGNLEQAKTFRAKKIQQWVAEQKSVSLSNFILFTNLEQFRGHHQVHGFFCGTFRERADIRDIVREIKRINHIHPSEELVPGIFVGRGVLPGAAVPYTNDVMCMSNGVTQQPLHDFIATKELNGQVTIEFTTPPPPGAVVSVLTKAGTNMMYHCDGALYKFMLFDPVYQGAWPP